MILLSIEMVSLPLLLGTSKSLHRVRFRTREDGVRGLGVLRNGGGWVGCLGNKTFSVGPAQLEALGHSQIPFDTVN